jgi:hypothetical protein
MTHSLRTALAVLSGVGVLAVAAPAGALPAVLPIQPRVSNRGSTL